MKGIMKKNLWIIIITAVFVICCAVNVYTHIKYNRVVKSENVSTERYSDPLTDVFFEDKLIDAGDLKRDTVIYQSYIMKNIGNNPLIVYYVNPDCNCTDYSLSQKVALPGDSIRINLTIETAEKHKGMFMVNTIVRMNTEDQMYRLRLQGNIVN